MPISALPIVQPGQAAGAATSFPMVGGGGLPAFPMMGPNMQTGGAGGTNIDASPGSVISLLSRTPTSLTQNLLPGLMQILGLQSGMQLPFLEQQKMGMVADAQSDAMKRGMTGSSLEAASMLGARSAGNMNIDQFLAQQLGTLGGAYTNAMTTDVQAQNQQYSDLAQALAQLWQVNMQGLQFQGQLNEMSGAADKAALASKQSALIGAGASLGAGAITKYCDRRLKKNVKRLARWRDFNLYAFDYRVDEFPGIPLPKGRQVGLMADEVERVLPDVVKTALGVKYLDFHRLAVTLGY